MKSRLFLTTLLAVTFAFNLLPGSFVRASGLSQSDVNIAQAQQLLGMMTPEEKVGQLFLVTFTGTNVNEKSQIYDLITRYHIGGIVLRADNDNFVAAPDTVLSAYQLISQLQESEKQASEIPPTSIPVAGTPTPAPTTSYSPANYIPLFTGISQQGDGFPNDQILSGLTPLPDLLAIGATWDPSLAEKVGEVAGQELSSVGFNFFIGPPLDVLNDPENTFSNGLNANVFGGDPYWVGILGGAFISGLHSGSNQRMLVVADHFPGRGNADRPAGGEPATVRRSLDQLKQVDLAPYFAVTGSSNDPQGIADGLLVSHIRYQGFQGNIRSTTRPVSVDPQALTQQIMSLSPLASWRKANGLLVSDDLGSQTLRKFYDPGGLSFQARLVALDAFLAGNDLLYMGNIVSSDEKDNYTSVIQAVDFFIQKYSSDSAFAKRVDDSVLRILAAKFKLYGNFDPTATTPPETGLSQIGKAEAITLDVANRSATLVNPDVLDLETVLPSPPALNDHIVFLTDARNGRQCSSCPEEPLLAPDSLQNAIIRLYGSQAGGQVIAGRLVSFSFDSLSGILEGGKGNKDLEDALRQASWVVLNLLDAAPGQTQTELLHRFLSERQDLLRDKRIVLFSFNAPYFLDPTDISKVSAYYCLYGKSAPFVEAAARILFRELAPVGSLPVSVTGIGYDLHAAIGPDPNQVIDLSLDFTNLQTPVFGTLEPPQPTPTPNFRIGDTVSARTGVIVDHNGHSVPDGTKVQFRIALNGAGGVVQQIESTTIQGVAKASFSIDRPGLLEISASSDPAITSVVLQLNVTNQGSSVTVVTPTPIPEFTPTPTIPSPTPTPTPLTPMERGHPGFSGWLAMVFVLTILGLFFYWIGIRFSETTWGVRWAICVVMGGILSYTYIAMQLPGASLFIQKNGWWGLLEAILLGGLVGFLFAYGWYVLAKRTKRPPN